MFVQPDDLSELTGDGGGSFEELLYDLIVEEASRHGIPLSAIHWDHRTPVGDGGRDIVIDAEHSDPKPRFIPQRRSIWSAKSGENSIRTATLKKEIREHPKVRKHLENGNSYIWCSPQPIKEDDREALEEAARELASEVDGSAFDPNLIEFRFLTTIYSALNEHLGLIAKHFPQIDRLCAGVRNLVEWEGEAGSGFRTPFVDFAARSKVVEQIRDHLRARSGPNVLHVAGLSGVGKTRTVLEACRAQRDLSGVLYVPRLSEFSGPFLRRLSRHPSAMALLVVDEVPIEGLQNVIDSLRRMEETVRLVTIGPARRGQQGRPDVLVLSEPETERGVLPVVRSANAGLSETVLSSIAHFSAHDLRLALMLVDATRRDGRFHDLPIEHGDEVWDRVTNLFSARIPDINAFRSTYPYLTIAIDIGMQGAFRDELEHIAKLFDVSIQRLEVVIESASKCGLGTRTSEFFEATPRALAGHLFRQFIQGLLQTRVDTLRDLPDRLLRRIVERCQEFAGPERQEMEELFAFFFLMELGDPDLTRLVDRNRSRLFKAWAELDPSRGLHWLLEATLRATSAELESLDGAPDGSGGWRGRRQIIWLCENLASFGEYFQTCEEILFRLAQVETEPSIGNNSTATWSGLFRPVFSYTEVPFPEREILLRRRLAESNEHTVRLILSAVVEAIEMPGGRLVPGSTVGGRLVPESWKPRSIDECRRLQQDLGRGVLAEIEQLPSGTRRLACDYIVSKLPTFVRFGLLAPLQTLLQSTDLDDDIRRSLRTQLRQLISVKSGTEKRRGVGSDPTLAELVRWNEELQPTDLLERIREVTASEYWDIMRSASPAADESSAYSSLANEVLKRPNTLLEVAEWLDSPIAKSAFNFGVALGEADKTESLAPIIASWIGDCRVASTVAGYLRAISAARGNLPPEWSARIEASSHQNGEFAALITFNAEYSPTGFERIMRLVGDKAIERTALGAFASPNWEPHLNDQQRWQVLHSLLEVQLPNSFAALRCALALAAIWCRFGKESVTGPLVEPVLQLLGDTLNLAFDPSEWSSLWDSVSAAAPQQAAELAIAAITSPVPGRVMLQDTILPSLLNLARSHGRFVMDAVGLRILDRMGRAFFGLLRVPGLFEAIGVDEVQRWVDEHDPKLVRHIARHLDSPTVEDGVAVVPKVTDWILSKFENDRDVFESFCMGCHNLEIRTGHARERRPDLDRLLEPFRKHEKLWIRQWAQYETSANDEETKLDDILDERQGRM